jgi:hypothetical protein
MIESAQHWHRAALSAHTEAGFEFALSMVMQLDVCLAGGLLYLRDVRELGETEACAKWSEMLDRMIRESAA